MNRFLSLPIALAAGLVMSSGAQAQSNLNLYGILDLSVGSFETSYNAAPAGAKSNRLTQVESGKMTTSFIGFKGTEDLGGGLKANFTLESFLRLDTGASGRSPADVFWARNANVGLSGGFGRLVMGRMDNFLFQQALAFNPYGGSFGFSPTIRMTFGGPAGNDQGNSGWGNSIAYYTPDFAGLKGAVQVQLGESTTESNSVGLMGSYTAGPFAVGLGYQSVKSAEAPKANLVDPAKQTFWLLGTSYDFGLVKAFVQYGNFDGSGFTPATTVANMKTKLFQLGASVPVGKDGKLLASYGQSTEKMPTADVKHTILTLGYDHNLSKRTDVYAVYMNDKEDVKGWKAGNTVAFGIRTRF